VSVWDRIFSVPKPDRPRDENAACVQTVNVYPDPAVAALLSELLNKVNQVLLGQGQQGAVLMTIATDLAAAKAALEATDAVISEVSADLSDLIAQLADAPANSALAAELKEKAEAQLARLQGEAAKHTPASSEPPAEPA
jgi:hypothetical protein